MSEYLTREQRRIDMVTAGTFGAVREHFSHLTIEEIISPEKSTADAYVALHVATAILCEDFDLSRREVSRLLKRSKGAVMLSIHLIRGRRERPVFDRAYQRIVSRAIKLLEAAERLAA